MLCTKIHQSLLYHCWVFTQKFLSQTSETLVHLHGQVSVIIDSFTPLVLFLVLILFLFEYFIHVYNEYAHIHSHTPLPISPDPPPPHPLENAMPSLFNNHKSS